MPLLFDMPWEQLQTYQGCNPRPKDFDAFWDKSLKEMEAIEPELELVPAPFQAPFAECFDMYFTGVGGARIHAKLLRPKNSPEPHPALLQFHGYTGNAGDWFDKLGYVAAGFTVAALDCRGQGGQSEDIGGVKGTTMRGQIIRGLDGPPEKLLFREIYLDTAQMARLVMALPEVDPKRVGATGGSQGGGLTLACAALTPGIRFAAPVFPFLTDYKRFWQMDLTTEAYMEIKTYFRQFDPLHEREEEIFTKLGYIDVQFLAPRIRAKVFMVTSLMDTVCPPSSQFAAYNKIASEKSLCVYPDFGHEFLPGVNDRIFEFMMGL